MGTKKKVALVTGGYTNERKISVKSTTNVYREIDKDRFDVYLIQLLKDGWYHEDESGHRYPIDKNDFSIRLGDSQVVRFDVAFICIHGSPGEDGRLQGYFDLIGLPYTSSHHLTMALTMNKAYTKAVVNGVRGLTLARSLVLDKPEGAETAVLESGLSFPLFIKPNHGGSSIGMSKVSGQDELADALDRAFAEDSDQHVLVEEFISGREFSMGVYNRAGEITALPPSEVIPPENFFDFQTKYHSDAPIDYTPGRLSPAQRSRMEACGRDVYRTLGCRGVVRIDFILNDDTDELYFLEVNTIPGQTNESFIPKQLRAAGIDTTIFFNNLIDEVLQNRPLVDSI